MTERILKILSLRHLIVAAIQCNGLWFAAGKFGITETHSSNGTSSVKYKVVAIFGSTDHQELDKVAQREAEESASAEVVEELMLNMTLQ